MTNYLDINKSVIISSPAGSGKTEKLARRYIALLESGVDIERILAVTFTDKAAAEMKQRILNILKKENKDLLHEVIEKMSLMRVSTIHSFCGTLLRRFSFEAEIDPNYTIEDATDSRISWEEILFETLMSAGRGQEGHEIFLQTIAEEGFRGLASLREMIDLLFEKSPFSLDAEISETVISKPDLQELKEWQGAKDAIKEYEGLFNKDSTEAFFASEHLFLTEARTPRKRCPGYLKEITDYQRWASEMYLYWRSRKVEESSKRAERIKDIFIRCLEKYSRGKRARGLLDFSDLEYITYKLLTENAEWANILYAFDEKTDHILVDEFQDTNNFQWAIIDSLTEEWRSGLGAKRDKGGRPTLFLVGDEKQSIYFFRGANVEIFQRAKEKLSQWLGDEFLYEEARDNFRSRPAIIEFANYLFSRIMQTTEDAPVWMTRYSPFTASRPGIPDPGKVEIIMLDDKKDESMALSKEREADIIARRINSLVGNYQITDRSMERHKPCSYADMAILLRKRTHLRRYEEALRKHNIPFVAVKGIGFYQETEVAMLRALIYFLSNPKDDYSLYILLKSPLFNIDESTIIKVISDKGGCLFERLRNCYCNPGSSSTLKKSLEFLEEWLSMLPHRPVAELIEHVLVQTGAWSCFREPQRHANIKKFIRLAEELEADGKSLFKIRSFLERTYSRREEPKANVNTEGMDAVKIMTIHAAKGLEFPVVFLPGLEEPFALRTAESLIYEKDGKLLLKTESEPTMRRQDEDFMTHLRKEEEEQKRLFYVAVTRAEEALFLISRWDERRNSFLGLLKDGLGLSRDNGEYTFECDIKGISLLSEKDMDMLYRHAPKPLPTAKADRGQYAAAGFIPMIAEATKPWKAVTETADIRSRHGKGWLVLGDIIHRIFEGVSKGTIREGDIRTKADRMLESRGVSKKEREEQRSIIEKDISLLKKKGVWQEIILPREDSFTELPFVLESGNTVYKGRVDRIIKDNDSYTIYDYKTFPVKEDEMEYLLKEYSFQLNIYKKAVQEIFTTQNVKSFILFTHAGEIRKIV